MGDKTGTGDYGTANDIGFIWPPGCKSIVLSIYFTQNKKDTKPNQQVVADAAKNLMQRFSKIDRCLQED